MGRLGGDFDEQVFQAERPVTPFQQFVERALQGGNTSVVITPDSAFFDYLNGEGGRPVTAPAP